VLGRGDWAAGCGPAAPASEAAAVDTAFAAADAAAWTAAVWACGPEDVVAVAADEEPADPAGGGAVWSPGAGCPLLGSA